MSAKKKLDPVVEAEKKVRRSKVTLISKHTFFGDLAFGMRTVITEDLNPPTAATDGESLFYHPTFVNSLTDGETVFVSGHEVLHAALEHVELRGNRDPLLWNLAADVVVNQLLVDNRVGDMPKGLIYDPDLYYRGNGSVIKIYDLLDKKDPRRAMDDLMPFKKGIKGARGKMLGKIQQAIERARQAGNSSGSLEALVKQLTEAKVRWEDELFAEMTADRGEERTYARRNRRAVAVDAIMPGIEGEKTGDFVFGIDCSGSTSDAMVAQSGAEVRRAMKALRPERTYIIYWDTQIKKVEVYGPDDEFEVKAYGRGGTSVGCVWDYIEEHDIEPSNCVIATDLLFGGDFGRTVPDYPVIWCVMDCPHSDKAPFGRVINTGMVNGQNYDDEW